MKHSFTKKSLSILLSLLMLLSVFGGMAITANAEGDVWSIAELQTGDAHGTATVKNGVLTYTNSTADYVEDGAGGITRGASGWWYGARFTLSDTSIIPTAKVKINSTVYNAADIMDAVDYFDLWAYVTEAKAAAALIGTGYITYTVSFYNAGDETATPDQTLVLRVDVRDIELVKESAPVFQTVDGNVTVGVVWNIAELQTGDALGTATVENGVLTYTNSTADYVEDGAGGITRGASGWWYGARFTLSDTSIIPTAKVKINSTVYNAADIIDSGDDYFDLWAYVTEAKAAAALADTGFITYTVNFYNAGDTTAAADQTLVLRVDVRDLELTKDGGTVFEAVNGVSWSVDELQTGDAHGTATIANGVLTYTNSIADYVEDGAGGIWRGASGWWFGARFTEIGALASGAKVKINSTVYNAADIIDDGDDYFDLWAYVTTDKVKTAVEGDGFITYTVSFYNAGDTAATPDQTLVLRVDVSDLQLDKDADVAIKTVAGAIEKVDPTYVVPTGLEATYGDTLADVTPALGDGWAWKDAATTSVGNAGNNTFTVVYTPANTDRYNVIEEDVTVAVAKADVTYTVPADLTAKYNQTLADVALPTGWTWDAPETVLTAMGENNYAATFTPADPANYNTYAGVDVAVTVGKADGNTDPAYAVPTDLAATYGDTLATVALPASWAWKDAATTSVGNAGNNTFTAIYTPADSEHYAAYETALTIAVAKQVTEIMSLPTTEGITFGQAIGEAKLEGGAASTPGKFTFKEAGTKPTVAQSGTEYQVVFTPDDTANFTVVDDAANKVAVPVKKARPIYTAPTAKKLVVNKQPQVLLDAGTVTGGTMKYAIATSESVPEASAFSTTIPSATDEGVYKVYYLIEGDEDHSDVGPQAISVTIHPTEFTRVMRAFFKGFRSILDTLASFFTLGIFKR